MHAENFPFGDINQLVHEPSRVAILTVLSGCKEAAIPFLALATSLSHANLAAQLDRLEQGGLVEIRRQLAGKTGRSSARLTTLGKSSINHYWRTMEKIREAGGRPMTRLSLETP